MRTGCFARRMIVVLVPCVVVSLLVGSLAGCGGGNPYKTVPVSGKVTYDDGSPIAAEELTVLFSPQVEAVDAKTHPRDVMATVNVADGTFSELTTYEYGDGLIPGEHKVAIQPMKNGAPVAGIVPAAYMDLSTTTVKVTVEPGMEPIVLTVPKN